MLRSFLIFFPPKIKSAFYWLNHCPRVGDFKRQDVAQHFKHLSLFMDVINFLLHHLMWHVLLQMCAQKAPRCTLPLSSVKVSQSCLTCFLCLTTTVLWSSPMSLWYKVSSGLCLLFGHSFHQHHAIPPPLISYTASDWSCGGRGLHVEEHVATRWMARSAPLSPLIVKY